MKIITKIPLLLRVRNSFFLLLAILSLSTTYAQIGIGTITPDASAALDVESTTQGFLPPRLSTTERNAINLPPAGLIIYNISVNKIQFYNGTNWIDFVNECIPTSQPIASVVDENIFSNQTEAGKINDGLVEADQGTALNSTAHYIVLDLGQIYNTNTLVKFDIWGNSTNNRTVRTSAVPAGSYIAGGGTNPQLNNVSVNTLDNYTYILQTTTRYVQVEMTVRDGGRTEFIEVTVTNNCQ